ncbi:hypothetical protein WDW37_01725 [Bdellovibrionota bacterium FG-1]
MGPLSLANRWIFSVFVMLIFYGTGLNAQCLDEINLELRKNHEILSENSFIDYRGAAAFDRVFGKTFAQTLRLLNEKAIAANEPVRWLDSGAGGADAISEFSQLLGLDRKFNYVALGFKKPSGAKGIYTMETVPGKRFRYLSDRYIEDYAHPTQEIGPCDLISDFFGPIAYTAAVDVVIKKYLELLKVGGKAYLLIPHNLKIKNMYFYDYLRKISGLTVESRPYDALNSVYELTKTGQTGDAPSLKLTHFLSGEPPSREFELK